MNIELENATRETLDEFFDLLDLDGGGSIDPGELMQSYMFLTRYVFYIISSFQTHESDILTRLMIADIDTAHAKHRLMF